MLLIVLEICERIVYYFRCYNNILFHPLLNSLYLLKLNQILTFKVTHFNVFGKGGEYVKTVEDGEKYTDGMSPLKKNQRITPTYRYSNTF